MMEDDFQTQKMTSYKVTLAVIFENDRKQNDHNKGRESVRVSNNVILEPRY